MNRNKNETLKIIFTLILLILAMVSMTMAIKKELQVVWTFSGTAQSFWQ